jgi:hypothetical protein
MKIRFGCWFLFVFMMVGSACSSQKSSPRFRIVDGVVVDPVRDRKTITPGKLDSSEVRAQINFKKAEIFNREFFYGFDLQYSSVYDSEGDLYNQSLAMGHVPAFFRKSGKELHLIADQRRLYPSDVNHPEQLISRYRILFETTDTMTVTEANSAVFISAMLDTKSSTIKDHWARSFEYVEKGNFLLQESSVMLASGDILEVMESVFPKSSISPSVKFEKFKMDPNDPVGASEGPAARYRMLAGEGIFNGEEKLSFAQHFDIFNKDTGAPETIDWYVTPNIKDEHLPVVKDAVEGWNRYFRHFSGIERDVVLFKGRMPEGMKLGDPRFNIINWDSRLIAGAAYESQANDPFTGKQSHSLIYMPVAWFQIGTDYWKYGQFTDAVHALDGKGKKRLPTRMAKPSCLRDLSGVATAIHSGRMSAGEVQKFSIQLMKQTLFHEVGHALGLAHNFKGSLSFDRQDPNSMFSTSIMDYNDYEIERAAFFDAPSESGDGPVLEYDRQALSALYNGMKDVGLSDPVVPVCNDAEADTEGSGAVDPFCIRYDIEKDPTLSIATAFDRVSKESIPQDVTLVQSMDQVTQVLFSDEELKKVNTREDADALYGKYLKNIFGVIHFYYLGGKASVSKAVRTNLKSLYVFSDGIFSDSDSERSMRERAFDGVKSALSTMSLPSLVHKKIEKLGSESSKRMMMTPYLSTLDEVTASTLIAEYAEQAKAKILAFESHPSMGLPRLRAAVLGSIGFAADLPFFFGHLGGTSFDFELSMATFAFDAVLNTQLTESERLAAARSLVSYRSRPGANRLISMAISKISQELATAHTNASRELAFALKTALMAKKQ